MMNQRNEYPRPQFQRDEWMTLNGEWDFAFDDRNEGLQHGWYKNGLKEGVRKIQVPFAYQAKASGIGEPEFHDVVWYERTFQLPDGWGSKEAILHFGAVDYEASVYVNGQLAGLHEGGHTPFSFSISHLLEGTGPQKLTVRVFDPSEDETIPRGKQYWKEQSESIFYTRTTGIWQPVWIEPVSRTRFESLRWTPDVDRGEITAEWEVPDAAGGTAELTISFQGQIVASDRVLLQQTYTKRSIDVRSRMTGRSNIHGPGWYWSPEHPQLFDAELVLYDADGREQDRVKSYFGMRKISIEDGVFKLNNKPYYQKLILDQGYFPEGLLTAPEDEDLKQDILLAKEMGFNGARKHQKVEDPRYLYWADQLGFLVWGEMANAAEYSEAAAARLTREWMEAVKRDYSHPSLAVWVPLNESWGISRVARDPQQQAHSLAMYYLTKSLDVTRPVLSNEGWEHTISDLCGIHNYRSAEKIAETYTSAEKAAAAQPAKRPIYANGYSYRGEPILLTEYGGIAYEVDAEGWGYSSVQSGDDLVREYEKVTEAILQSPVLQGFCYTQLTDVEQEINGLLTYDRKPKCDLEKIREINSRK